MKYLSEELCECLHKFGCVANSDDFWLSADGGENWFVTELDNPNSDPSVETHPAFTLLDFVDVTETARENCKKLFGEKLMNHFLLPTGKIEKTIELPKRLAWELAREQIIGLSDSNAVEEYIKKALEEK